MGSARPRWYIESEHFRTATEGEPVRVLDGGSSGSTFAPFDQIDARIELTGFDPDPRVVREGTIPKALWSRSGTADFHLAPTGVSSVYPPDTELLRWFPESVGISGRTTAATITVETISIDEAVMTGLCPPPDFIKLDVHSAEFEALEGATNTLGTALAVLVETWHVAVHEGQRLHGDVERLLNAHRFHLFDHCTAAAWRYTLRGEASVHDRPRLIASESLFFRDLSAAVADHRMAIVAIALSELYGYTNYALRLAVYFHESGAITAEEAQAVERELLVLRHKRTQRRLGDPGRPTPGQRVRDALRALRGQVNAHHAWANPLDTETQRLSRGPWE